MPRVIDGSGAHQWLSQGGRCAGTARSCHTGKSGISPLGGLRSSTVAVTPNWWTLCPTRPHQHSALDDPISVNPGSDSGMVKTLKIWYQCAHSFPWPTAEETEPGYSLCLPLSVCASCTTSRFLTTSLGPAQTQPPWGCIPGGRVGSNGSLCRC